MVGKALDLILDILGGLLAHCLQALVLIWAVNSFGADVEYTARHVFAGAMMIHSAQWLARKTRPE